LIWVAVVTVIWLRRTESPGALAALVGHLGILVPVLGLTEKPHFPGDRYALIDGVIITAALMIWWLHKGLKGRVWLAIAGCVICLLVTRTWTYIPIWRDDVTFFRSQARQLPLPNRNPAMERLAMALPAVLSIGRRSFGINCGRTVWQPRTYPSNWRSCAG
jgi:drug/metabolite transporter superfamily protein YnfA